MTKIVFDLPFNAAWETDPSLSKEELFSLLSQPFTYLNRGTQSYVFESQDHSHVIKLFRSDKKLFFPQKKEGKMEQLFSACLLAYKEAKEETGLVYLHLNETKKWLPTLRAKGPLGQHFSIPLDNYRFAIQKRAKTFQTAMSEALESGDPEAVKKKIDSFLALLHSRSKKGIRNTDPALGRNFGFLGDQAIEIDFGNYTHNSTTDEWEIELYTHLLRNWLAENRVLQFPL